MEKENILSNVRDLFYELRKSDYDKENTVAYIYNLLEDIIDKDADKQNEEILYRLKRARKNDFRYASGFFGRWAESATKNREINKD
jgi:type I site-specific restriction-modification system R (restriction) subunit